MVYDTARKLAAELRESAEYRAYAEAREQAEADPSTKALLDEYHRLQIQAQAAAVSGRQEETMLKKLQKIGELLQFDPAASAYLLAEYRLNRTVADVYKILAEAVGMDLGALEA